jgi:hypothetical protein
MVKAVTPTFAGRCPDFSLPLKLSVSENRTNNQLPI